MRILFISNSSSISGAPAALLNLIRGLKDRHDLAVVLPDSSGPLYDALSSMGVECYCEMPYRLTIWPRVINPFKFFIRLYGLTIGLKNQRRYVSEVIDRFRPDIVHTNVGPLDLALDSCRKRGIPHVWHLREFQNGMTFWPTGNRFRGRIMSEGNWNIAITSCVYKFWGLRECDTVIYDGVDLPVSIEETGNKSGNFLFVGRVERNKGLMELLKAYRLYRLKGGMAGLDVIGRISSFYGFRCKAYVAMHGLKSCVSFMGHRNDVHMMMKNALALVVPSRSEGFGLVSVEAMHAGCVVIGNDTTGMKEQFDIGREFTGDEIGIRYRGCKELSSALTDLSSGTIDVRAMKLRAKKTVESCYTVSRGIKDVEDYYVKILEDVR